MHALKYQNGEEYIYVLSGLVFGQIWIPSVMDPSQCKQNNNNNNKIIKYFFSKMNFKISQINFNYAVFYKSLTGSSLIMRLMK